MENPLHEGIWQKKVVREQLRGREVTKKHEKEIHLKIALKVARL